MMMSLTAIYTSLLCYLLVLPWTQSQETGPSLKTGSKTETSTLGGSVFLECQVLNPGNYSVSWYFLEHNVRISDNLDVLIASRRFSVEQPQYAGVRSDGNHTVYFSLNIFHLKSSDQGTYYCKVEGMDDKMIYDLVITDAKRPTPPVSVPIANHTDCCIKEKVSAGCLPICDRSNMDPGFNPSLCSGDVVKLIKCGTDGRNHVSCCRRRQVPVNCLELCSSSSPTIGPDQFICDQYDAQINGCFNEGQVTLPSPPREVTAAPTTNGVIVDWLSPEENSDLVTGYRVAYRSVKRTSLTFQTTEVLTVDSRSKLVRVPVGGRYQVYVTAISPHGASQPSPVIEVYAGPDPDVNSTQNVNIRECCKKHHVLFECEDNFCNTRGFRALENLNIHYCQTDLPNIFHCIAGGQDHAGCCRTRGFPEQCIPLCSGQMISFNETLLACLVQLQTVEECLQEGFTVLPAAPQNVRVESIGTNSAVLEWEQAYAGTSPVDRYIVQYRIRTPTGLVPYQEIITQGTFAILSPLRPDTVYDATITSEHGRMSSPPSPTLIFQTYPEELFITSSPADNSSDIIPAHPDMEDILFTT
ncbi:Ig-like and fibronectin type-III domain-containing protein 1 [Liolophura sinensis]|uniref:Ig-like and fibronectin type-III domain-containing protein 1 n=1 Tax=Liolophura sinensis TaxID=3198878 RepID=UPI003158DB3C